MIDLKAEAGPFVTSGILTGGGSRRFGRDKALFPWKGQTLLEWTLEGARNMTQELYLLAKDPSDYLYMGVPVLDDGSSVPTPLNGILSVMPHVHDWLLLLACDIPFFDKKVLELLWEYRSRDQATVLRFAGKYQPFLGLYPVSVLPYWEEAFYAGEYHLQRVVERMPRIVLEEEELLARGIRAESFSNINCPADLEKLAL
jgi:molybdopterin-guanine dinucleotide biosynthesis protein A